ncbi:hypothetical protein [Actinokineospora diospyrosa]|uniref:Uncharacterized protein n=1 Tax=Actinokineospora diospyrosa TaxID=103728 RepID=A0ABT1IKX5_9PSEU|nr:hypothetical protein [Actinokineospora diospyrosa]MCP2272866.1 hypothetical protein [Actinokineospora diospyrosa]
MRVGRVVVVVVVVVDRVVVVGTAVVVVVGAMVVTGGVVDVVEVAEVVEVGAVVGDKDVDKTTGSVDPCVDTGAVVASAEAGMGSDTDSAAGRTPGGAAAMPS